MTDCNTSSSNISGTPIAGTVIQVGSRLEIGPIIQIGHGFTSGSVIRFDVSTNGYTLAQANTPANAEVCGVVNESVDLNIFNYVVHGEIDTTTFSTTGTIQGSTASEVFYLSSVTAGSVDSVAPQDSGNVLKTVLIRTPSINVGGVIQHRAIVKNYVGNYLGGDTALYMSGVNPVGSIHAFVGAVSSIPVGWALCDGRAINNSTYPLYEPVINKRYGYRDSLVFTGSIDSLAVYIVASAAGGNIYAKIISSIRDDNLNTTTLVVEYEIHNKEDLEGTRGGDGTQASKETTNIILPRYDSSSSILFLDANRVLFPNQGQGKTTSSVVLDSSLTPDLRNKFIFGATDDTTSVSGLNQKGGYVKNNYNTIDRITASDVQQGFADNTDTGINSLSNMPPYVTLNWIIRVGDASYTAFLNDLSLKTLSLTDIPSSDPGVAGSLYAGVDGILKVSG